MNKKNSFADKPQNKIPDAKRSHMRLCLTHSHLLLRLMLSTTCPYCHFHLLSPPHSLPSPATSKKLCLNVSSSTFISFSNNQQLITNFLHILFPRHHILPPTVVSTFLISHLLRYKSITHDELFYLFIILYSFIFLAILFWSPFLLYRYYFVFFILAQSS